MSEENKTKSKDTAKGHAPSGVTINKLTFAQRFEVTRWIDSWREIIPKEAWTAAKCHEEVARKVMFSVTEENVKTALNDLGIKTVQAARTIKNSKWKKSMDRIDALEKSQAEYKAALDALEVRIGQAQAQLTRLLTELGVTKLDDKVRDTLKKIAQS